MRNTDWNAGLYDSRHAFVWKYGEGLLPLLDAKPGERILDLGCGTGHLTHDIAQTGAAVVGVDASPAMVEQARAHYPGIPFEVMDARALTFREEFDAVFSNAALHWIQPPEPVIASVWHALKPGGRFVAEFGGRGNIAAVVAALYEARTVEGRPVAPNENPWYYPSLAEYAGLLEAKGFRVAYAAHFDRFTPLAPGESGLRDWLAMFAGPLLDVAGADARERMLRRIEERLRATLWRDGAWHVDYVRLRVIAERPRSAGSAASHMGG